MPAYIPDLIFYLERQFSSHIQNGKKKKERENKREGNEDPKIIHFIFQDKKASHLEGTRILLSA